MKKEWEKQIDSLLEAYHPEMIEKLRELIRIKSVYGPAEENAPFGVGPRQAFDFAMRLGEEKEFECVNFDYRAGEINFGQGEEAAGVISVQIATMLVTPSYALSKSFGSFTFL